MSRFLYGIAIVLMVVISTSCEMLDVHPHSVHITGARNVNAQNIKQIEELCASKDTIRFVLTGDTQSWYDETCDMVRCVNSLGDIDFVVHGGDVSDYGMTEEFMMQRDIFQGFNCPFVTIIGNHDCLGTGEQAYEAIFGATNFTFKAGKVRFICLNTNAMDFGFPEDVPDLNYMQQLLDESKSDSTWQYTVVSMHVQPATVVFNNKVMDQFEEYVRSYPKTLFCTAAHDHYLSATDIFGDGIVYHRSASMDDRTITLITIMGGTYEYEYITF